MDPLLVTYAICVTAATFYYWHRSCKFEDVANEAMANVHYLTEYIKYVANTLKIANDARDIENAKKDFENGS